MSFDIISEHFYCTFARMKIYEVTRILLHGSNLTSVNGILLKTHLELEIISSKNSNF